MYFKTSYVCKKILAMKLSDQVSNKIRDDINIGRYKAGEKIPTEPELMQIYGVGRSSIREAVKSLAMAGILTVQQGAGTTVNADRPETSIDEKIRRADFDEVNAVRNLLEKEMVLLAIQHQEPSHLQQMENYLAQRKAAIQAEDRQLSIAADINFHLAIADASGNSVLADLYKSFTQVIRNFFSEREKKGVSHFALSHHLHEQLFNSIREKESDTALKVLQQILTNNY